MSRHSKTETVIAEAFEKETEKSWVVWYRGCKAVLPKSTCNWHGKLVFEVPLWLARKMDEAGDKLETEAA